MSDLPGLDGPHSPETTRAAAARAAEAIRFLNYATGSHAAQGLRYPADVDAVVQELAIMAQRLPQLLDQFGGWVAMEQDVGRGGAVLDWIAERFDVGVRALRRRAQCRHEQRLELRRLELEIAQAKTGTAVATAPEPGLCRHRQAVPVRDSDGNVVAWLCRSCDTQLPPEFSIYAEDL